MRLIARLKGLAAWLGFGKDHDFPIDAWTDPVYTDWSAQNKASEETLDNERNFQYNLQPKFSFVVPLYKTPLDYFNMMVKSVLDQTYPNFELILVNGSPDLDYLSDAISLCCESDDRVIEVRLENNLGIAENTREGVAVSGGDFVCFLDHDDSIEPNLLYEYVKDINEDHSIDIIYCDEDLMEVRGAHAAYFNPLFKPSYSPELLLCKNYILHLLCIRRSVLDLMEPLSSDLDGAQDYHMITQGAKYARKIHHVQKVLYHWRVSDTSTAANPDAKPFGLSAYKNAILKQVDERWNSASIISSGIPNIFNIWFERPQNEDLISVIVSCDSDRDVKDFKRRFEEINSWRSIELVFIGNGLSASKIEDDDVKVIELDAFINEYDQFNIAAKHARGEFLLFMDKGDVFVTAEPLEQLYALASSEGVGVTGPKSLYSDGTNKCYGVAITPERIMPLYRGYPDDFPGYQCNLRAFQNVSAISKDGMMISKSIFEEVGGFDPAYSSEIGVADLCKKVTDIGYRIVTTPTVKLQTSDKCPENRYDNKTNAPDFAFEDLVLFDQKWPSVRLAGDPYFNKNLDQGSSYFQIAKSE